MSAFRLCALALLFPALLIPNALADGAKAAAPAQSAERLAPGAYRWLSEGPWNGPVYMVISLERQMVHVYSGDLLIGMASVSTGTKGHVTPKGEFPILQKRAFHRSNLYSNAPMPFMQRLTWDGIALHAGHNPGYPASHGCIRMPYAFAQRLFQITRIGTLVSVTAGRLKPALALDPLLLSDPGSMVVTFTPRATPLPRQSPMPLPRGAGNRAAPLLTVDPSIFELPPSY